MEKQYNERPGGKPSSVRRKLGIKAGTRINVDSTRKRPDHPTAITREYIERMAASFAASLVKDLERERKLDKEREDRSLMISQAMSEPRPSYWLMADDGYLQGEAAAKRVIEIIADAHANGDALLMSVINAGEIWYSVASVATTNRRCDRSDPPSGNKVH